MTPDGLTFVGRGINPQGDTEAFIARITPPGPGITVNPTSGLVTGEDLTSDTFIVALDTQPTADVTIGISSSNTGEGTTNVASRTFTTANWDVPQTVTVTGVDDAVQDGDVAYSIITAVAVSTDPYYNGINASDVSVTNLDNEFPAGVTVTDLMPNTMSADDSGPVTINGSGFEAGASVTFKGGSGPAPKVSNIVVASDGLSITATVSTNKKAKESAWDVVVTNTDGSTDSCVGCFTVTVSASSSTLAASESTAASLDDSTSDDASDDDAALVSIAAPLPATDTGSTSSAEFEPATATTDDSDAVDEALADFDVSPLDDALLEDLVMALVG